MIWIVPTLWYLHIWWCSEWKDAESERLTLTPKVCVWSLNCCLQMFWVSKSNGRENAKFFDSKGRTKVFFLFGNSGFFFEGFTVLFSLFWQFSLSNHQPLESVMEQLIYRWICCDFGVKNKWDLNLFWHPVPLLFHPCFRMLVWCNYGMQA